MQNIFSEERQGHSSPTAGAGGDGDRTKPNLRWMDGGGGEQKLWGPTLGNDLGGGEVIALDVETFWDKDYNVTNGLNAYVNDPRFQITVVGLFCEEWSWVGDPSDLPVERLEGRTILAHNAPFDQRCCEESIRRGDMKDFTPAGWYCTMDMARKAGYPGSLAESALWILGQDLDKEIRTNSKGKDKATLQADVDFVRYCLNDASSCYWMGMTLIRSMPSIEAKLSALTSRISNRGLVLDSIACEKGVLQLEEQEESLASDIPWEGAKTSVKLWKDYCARLDVRPPETTNIKTLQFLNWEQAHPLPAKVARTMSNIRKVKKMMATLRSLLGRQSHEGIVEMPLRYYGAHTGRWSGQGGINFQALAKKELFGVYIGKFLRARDGHTLVKLDLSNIEARVLLWLAGDDETLELIRKGMDIYEAHARSCGLHSGKEKLAEVNPDLRQLCKARVLGLGFGCGAKTFQSVAAAMTGGDLQLSEDESADAVYQYRQQNPKVTRMWSELELFMSTRTAGRTVDLMLPSGRSLVYDITSTTPLKGSYIKGKPPVSLWGGTLTENVTQAVARDILALALLRLDGLGYHTVLHIHDSVIIEVPEDKVLVETNQMIEALTTPPDWASGLPLDADVEVGDHL